MNGSQLTPPLSFQTQVTEAEKKTEPAAFERVTTRAACYCSLLPGEPPGSWCPSGQRIHPSLLGNHSSSTAPHCLLLYTQRRLGQPYCRLSRATRSTRGCSSSQPLCQPCSCCNPLPRCMVHIHTMMMTMTMSHQGLRGAAGPGQLQSRAQTSLLLKTAHTAHPQTPMHPSTAQV